MQHSEQCALIEKCLRYTLPLPPSVNHMYRNAGRGKRIKTQAATDWIERAQWEIKIAARAQGWKLSEGEKLVMKITAFWPDNRRRDVHNLHKLLCDVPEEIAYDDDKYVIVQDQDFSVDRVNPRVEVELMRKEGSS